MLCVRGLLPHQVNVYDHLEFSLFPGVEHIIVLQLTSAVSADVSA